MQGFETLKHSIFLLPKKVSYLSRTLLNFISSSILPKTLKKNKLHFLEKFDFWDFDRLNFLRQKCFFFFLKHY